MLRQKPDLPQISAVNVLLSGHLVSVFESVALRECGRLLCEKDFALKLIWSVYRSHVRPAVLYRTRILRMT